MNRLRLLVLAATACVFAALAGPASAQSLTPQDRAAIEARVARMEQIISSGDLTGAIEMAPPRVIAAIAQRAGITPDELRAAMRDAMADFDGVTIVSFGMDVENAPPLQTPDGSRTYVLIPTEVVMEVTGVGGMRARGHTLALEDEGEWYLIRVEEAPQVALVRELWPEFTGVEFPAGTTQAVD